MTSQENTDHSQKIRISRSSSRTKREDVVAVRIRRDLAMIITALLVVVALIAAFQIGAMPVLDKMLPLVAIIFGFFFGHRASKH